MRAICPKPASLTAIPAYDCEVSLDQIVRLAFQRRQTDSPFPAAGATPMVITDIASWTPLLASATSTKVTVTPFFDSFVIPQSEGQEEGGGDNSTVFGIPIDMGENAVKVTGQHRNLPANVKRALEDYRAESQSSKGISGLTVFLFNRHGEIIHNVDADGNPVGIPVYNYRLSSRGSEGYNQSDKIGFSFYLAEGWDRDVVVTKPDFNPLLEL